MRKRIKIPKDESGLEAFAMIVDINGFTLLVNSHIDASIAQFTHDVLIGGIGLVEEQGGQVVGLMGDAFYALLPDAKSVVECSIGIAIDINKQCEYLDHLHSDLKSTEYPEGIGVKIAVEYGSLDVANIQTRAMRRQRLFVGEAVIYATRISGAGKGNRCLLGPVAAEMVQEECDLKGPYKLKGKEGEPLYTYYRMDLSEVWLEGPVSDGKWYLY
jgi:class 3 adenylate cyclase